MTIAASAPRVSRRRLRLWVEFCVIFLALPLVMALHLSPRIMWSALAAMFVASVVLLSISDGFRWRDLVTRPAVADWWALAAFVAASAAVAVGLVVWMRPHALFSLPRYNTDLWLTIMLAYPFLSALPQEVVFRGLFFGRYGALFPDGRVAILANAAVFSLAHLFYWNWPAVVLTAAGGVVFAWAYRERGSFLFAWILHALAGQIVFTSGLGTFFYHGAVR